MAYYQGDYYQGDYYQGDPFLGALLGKGIGWLAKKIFKRKITTAGQQQAGAMVVQRGGQIARRGAGAALVGAAATGMTIPLPGPFQMRPGAFLPGGKPLFSRVQADVAGPLPTGMAAAGCCPSGYHMSKDGSGRCVRNRSMNVANPRALRRSLRRVAGFGKLAMRAKKDVRRAAKSLGA